MKRHHRSDIQPSFLHAAPASLVGVSTRNLSFAIAACAALLGVACEGDAPRDLGSSSALLTTDVAFNTDVNELSGLWVGEAEDTLALNGNSPTYHFPSGSTSIVLEVAASPNDDGLGPLRGHITFGSGAPLPPPTDPDQGFPVGLSYDALLAYDDLGAAFATDHALPPFEGVDYPVGATGQLNGTETGETTAADGVVSFTFSSNQPLDAWCRLQTPFPSGAVSGYSCVPDLGGQFEVSSPGTDATCGVFGPPDVSQCADPADFAECIDFGEPVAQFNCDKLFLCELNYCTCSEEGCAAADTNERLTVRRVGSELVGIFQDTVFVNERNLRVPLGEVRLRRAD
jgi:hypothetical protein